MKTSRILLPVLTGILIIAGWEALVRIADLPPYLLPAPSRIAQRLVEEHAVQVGAHFFPSFGFEPLPESRSMLACPQYSMACMAWPRMPKYSIPIPPHAMPRGMPSLMILNMD